MKVALASCRTLPEPDPDQDILLASLRDEGAEPRVVAWEDSVDYREFDLCVIRSTWNYVHRRREFLDWARRVSAATLLRNPLEVVLWNTDKSYLARLSGRFTHAVRKTPRFSGAHEAVSVAVPVAADEEAFGREVLESFKKDLLYARVDVVRMPDGSLALMELELVEPSLFLAQKPEALGMFARACVEARGEPRR